MHLSKKAVSVFISGLVGFIALVLFWTAWNASIEVIVINGFLRSGPKIAAAILLLVLVLSQFGLTVTLVNNKRTVSILYGMWSVSVMVVPLPLPIMVKLFSALVLFLLFQLCDLALRKRIKLLVKPVFSLMYPSFFKLWLFGLTGLLAMTIALHPSVLFQEQQITIPQELWEQLWNMFGVQLKTEGEEVTVKGATSVRMIQDSSEKTLGDQDYENISDALAENGINIPNIEEFIRSFTGDQSGAMDINQISGNINEAISNTVKSETENMLSKVLEPLNPFWPYLVALSFFLSVQILLPVFVLLGLMLMKITIRLLISFHMIELIDEKATISRYVLK